MYHMAASGSAQLRPTPIKLADLWSAKAASNGSQCSKAASESPKLAGHVRFVGGSPNGSVVQRTGHFATNEVMRVRFLPDLPMGDSSSG